MKGLSFQNQIDVVDIERGILKQNLAFYIQDITAVALELFQQRLHRIPIRFSFQQINIMSWKGKIWIILLAFTFTSFNLTGAY